MTTHQTTVVWGQHAVRLKWQRSKLIGNKDTVTSVHGCCFHEGKILLVKVKKRGFNLPGGHIEGNETPEEALHREVFEEGYVKGKATYIGAIEVNHEENPYFDPNGKYPMIGYQLFYRLDIEECHPFQRKHETTTRIWMEPEEVPYVIDDHDIIHSIIEEAKMVKSVY